MIKKAIFPRCYLQGKDILRNLGGISELENKKVFVLATNAAVKQIIPENLSAWRMPLAARPNEGCGASDTR